MSAARKNITRFSILLGLLSLSIISFAQSDEPDPEKWAIELNKKGIEGNESFGL